MIKKPTNAVSPYAPSRKLRGIEPPKRYAERQQNRERSDASRKEARPLARPRAGGTSTASLEERALQLFPGDKERAHRLFSVFSQVRDTLFIAADKKLVDIAEHRAVLSALLTYFPAPQPQPSAPNEAPELWAKRDLNLRENAPAFIRRVYAAWLGHGLARKDITRLDEDLYKALSVWLYRHPDDEIARELPPQSDVLDDLIKRLSADYPVEVLRKLGYAIDARLRRDADSSQAT